MIHITKQLASYWITEKMTEYEYRRTVFYQLNEGRDFPDNHRNFDIAIHDDTVVEDAVAYLTLGASHTRFPGAARAVAIATADFLNKNFGVDFYEALNDKNLMHGNDPYFKTYEEDKGIYDAIITWMPRKYFNWKTERMQITHKLLMEEYMLDDAGLTLLPRSSWK